MIHQVQCRFCDGILGTSFANLGRSPLSNAFLPADADLAAEPTFPLHAKVCDDCRLVQLTEAAPAQEIFSDYLYFSSYAESWLRHAEVYASEMVARFGLNDRSRVVELASNDGYLLQYFVARGIPALGVEPAANVAAVAVAKGVPTEVAFFGIDTARRLLANGPANLITANNVLAHVPDLNDFVGGIALLLAPDGVATLEFPHLLQLIDHNQFDTIYHEHFSYFSLLTAERVLARHGLALFDVAELPTHGGSLRLFVQHAGAGQAVQPALAELRAREVAAGLDGLDIYRQFVGRVAATRDAVRAFLLDAQRAGKRAAGYGAPAKGNTLLNFCGVGPELLGFTVDRNPHKQGLLLPGTHIPIRAPEAIMAAKPDYVLILPWNLRAEITAQMAGIREWGGKFVVPIPRLEVF